MADPIVLLLLSGLAAGFAALLLYQSVHASRRAEDMTGVEASRRKSQLGASLRSARDAVFRVDGGIILPLNTAAQRMLDSVPGEHTDAPPRRQLFLETLFPEEHRLISDRLDALGATGMPFALGVKGEGAAYYDLSGQTHGAMATLSILDITAWRGAEQIAALDLEELRRDHAIRGEALVTSTAIQWRIQPSGELDWTNAGADRDRTRKAAHLITQLKAEMRDNPDRSPTRLWLPRPGEGAGKQWFGLRVHNDRDGGQIFCATPIDEVIQAETALARFVESLTESFALLPMGMAVFDPQKSLSLYNEALCDMLELDEAWLSSGPSMSAFLERLRETRMIPEQQSFRTWRERFIALHAASEDAEHEDTWVLPTGVTLRVRMRSHRYGTFAILFDDITERLETEQSYREAIMLRDTALDRLPFYVAVFDAAGQDIRGGQNGAPARSIARRIDEWRDGVGDGPVWERLERFVRTGGPERTPFRERLSFDDNGYLDVCAMPLPGGGTAVALLPIRNPQVVDTVAGRPSVGIVERILLDATRLAADARVDLIVAPTSETDIKVARPEVIRALTSSLIVAALAEVDAQGALRLTVQSKAERLVIVLSGIAASGVERLCAPAESPTFHALLDQAGGRLVQRNLGKRATLECSMPLAATLSASVHPETSLAQWVDVQQSQ